MITHFNEQILPYTGKLPLPGLIKFLNQFGSVWYGTLTKKEFVAKFNRRMFSMLSELTDLDNIIINQDYKIDQIRFNMDLAAAAQKIENWYWPAVAYNYIDWPTGNSRMFATGLTHSEPWKALPVLAICQSECPDFLDDPVEIVTDSQFNQLIGFEKWAGPGMIPEVFLELKPNGQFSITFREIDPYLKHKKSDRNRFNEYLTWFNQNQSKVRIGIYTDWPDKICDSFSYWDYEILGTSPFVDPKRPGTLEKNTLNPNWPQDVNYLLLVTNPMQIDLSQFLIFIDTKHYQFADKDWRFSLISKQGLDKSTKIVSIVDIQSMQQ